tara:strand:+ start:28127 stop:28534 length:408 start_codon:yes stop_codon:yes gene_type:complete
MGVNQYYYLNSIRREAVNVATKEVAEKYRMTPANVKKLVQLAGQYNKSHINEIDFESDLFVQTNSWQLPGSAGTVRVHFLELLLNMRQHGHISARQWDEFVKPMYGEQIDNYERRRHNSKIAYESRRERSKHSEY